jgi:hypothetical protein
MVVAVVDIIDNVFSEGIDSKRFIKSEYRASGEMLKITVKERNEQADLLKKEVTTSIDAGL